ncbi:hypothetical protein ILYODFUR_007045 [Ilyodon furcidens]|uniref:Uncharacterized protein n=1 Tax=Ilyodon furcidens TaxID=33524 RepID=A0ABV0USR4_9TELE
MDGASLEVPSESSAVYKTGLFPPPQTTTQKTWMYISSETSGRKIYAGLCYLHVTDQTSEFSSLLGNSCSLQSDLKNYKRQRETLEEETNQQHLNHQSCRH